MAQIDYREHLSGYPMRSDAAVIALALARLKRKPGQKGVGGNRDDHPHFTAAAEVYPEVYAPESGTARVITPYTREVVMRARTRVIRYARQACTGPWADEVMTGQVSALLKIYADEIAHSASNQILEDELQEALGYGIW